MSASGSAGEPDADAAWDDAAEAGRRLLLAALPDEPGRPPPAGLSAAAAGVREGIRLGMWPLDWIGRGAGFGAAPPRDPADLLLESVAALVAPEEPTGLSDAEEALLLALQPADWAAAVLSVARAGSGIPVTAEGMARAAAEDAAEDGVPLDRAEYAALREGFALALDGLTALGAVDDRGRLTSLGGWLLPRGVFLGLGSDLDA